MKAVDYKEIAEMLQEVVWDVEDALDTCTMFTDDRLEQLVEINEQCVAFINKFREYELAHIIRNDIDWEKVVFNLNCIKNWLMHFSGSIEYLCNNKLMGHNLDLTNRQFDLNFDCLCVTIKEVAEHKFEIVGSIEIYDDAGNHIISQTMAEIKKKYIEYRNNNTNKEIENL